MLTSSKLFETAQNQLDHNRLFALINSLSDAFLAVDNDGFIRLSNGVALNLLDTNSLDGQKIAEKLRLVDKNGSSADIIQLIKSVKTSLTSRDYSLAASPDSTVSLYLNIAPVRAAFGKNSPDGHVIILRDITHEKIKEDERDEFISVASHELRTPVTVAEGSLSNALMLAERSKLPDSILGSLKSAHEQIVFLMSLINDLALLSRADASQASLLVEDVDVTQLMAEIEKDYQAHAQKKALTLEIKVEPGTQNLYNSKLYIREILQNLITNAIKYTAKGSVTINVKTDGISTFFDVADSGIGIDKIDMPKLFHKFFRSEDSRVREVSGTGLGLYISAKLANMIGAKITASSQLNSGSRFVLIVPNSVYHKPAS